MLKVGITGGIGSGKTTVCKIFETLGVPVYYSDDNAKMLMNTDENLIRAIKKLFGNEAYTNNGQLNRQHIATVAFANAEVLKQLNSLVHPAVYRHSEAWAAAQTAPYILKEAALHFESGGYRLMDKMITVFAPTKIRIQRVMQRDNMTKTAVEARMNQQMPDEEKIKLSDFVIYNNSSKSLITQVLSLHRTLLKLEKNL